MTVEQKQEIIRLREERDLWKANHDNMVKLNKLLRERPDLGDRSNSIQELVMENQELRQLLNEARAEAIRWQDAWMWEKSLEDMHPTVFPWTRRALDDLHNY